MSTSTKQKKESLGETLAPHDAIGVVVNTALQLRAEGHSHISVRNHPKGILIIMAGYEIKDGMIVLKESEPVEVVT